MSFRVVIEAEAGWELAEAVDFYDRREPGLGQRFANDLRALFKAVGHDPERFPPVSRLTRKAKLSKPWPCSAYFALKRETSEVVIVAIWHSARNPTKLRVRLK